jgi:phage I-like protein
MKSSRPPSSHTAVALAALSVDLSDRGGAPSEFRIVPAGSFRAWDGRPEEVPAWICDEADGRVIIADLLARERDTVIDYEHATLKAKTGAVKAPAAGWFRDAEWRPDGVWLKGVRWTAQAAREIANREYRYVSPVLLYDPDTGHVRGLRHVALTNDPGLSNLTDLAALAAQLFLDSPKETPSMDLLKKLLTALDLAETATAEEALSAVAALKTQTAALSARAPDPRKYIPVAEVEALKAKLADLSAQAPDPAKYAPATALAALQADNAALAGKLAALQGEVDKNKLDALIAAGKAAGKLPPAKETWARELGKKDLAALTAYLAVETPAAPVGGTQTGGQAPSGGGADPDGKALAEAALAYQAELAARGLSVTTVQAVAHVLKKGA